MPISAAAGLAWPSSATILAPLAPSAVVGGDLQFASQNPSGQQSLINSIYTPGSPQYHQFLTGDQFDDLFGPSSSLQAKYLSELQGYGLSVTQTSPFMWYVQGSAMQMGEAFGTTFSHAEWQGHLGYAPATPMKVPSAFQSLGITTDGGFETVLAQFSTPLYHAPMIGGERPSHSLVSPHTSSAALTINLTNQYIVAYQKAGAVAIPPTNTNETWNLSLSGGTPPYSVSWHWGDGVIQHFTSSGPMLQVTHDYYTPGEIDSCYNEYCGNISIYVTDSASGNASASAGLIVSLSPWAAQTFYNTQPLYTLGDSGAGTSIGFGELCDPDFPAADYTTDLQIFSSNYGLPAPKVTLIGTGDTTCSPGYATWSGETTLDMEWAHTIAPNATLVVDLADSNPDEGDCTWDTLSNGVFVASNSWTGAYTESCWTTAESQGQSFLSSTGDSGGPGFSSTESSYPPIDPNDVGVGGTFVYPTSSGIFHAEYAWNGTTITESGGTKADVGSTGGCSTSVATPAYQTGMTGFACKDRGAPDVAAMGGTWVSTFQICTSALSTAGGCGSTSPPFWSAATGTSLASPSWAAFLDLAYTYNGTGTKANGNADWQLYAIAKSSTTNYDTGFHDITMGSNKIGGTGDNAGVGWDAVTGLGSFNGAVLAEMMAVADGNTGGISALTAVLSSNTTLGPASLSVAFGADVTGGGSALAGYSYAWTFGDGGTATTSVPYATHVYTTPGRYLATVAVTLGSNTGTSKPVVIHVSGSGGGSSLSITASSNRTSATIGMPVSFTSAPTGGSGTYSTYAWRFGDGTTAATQNPTHSYAYAGTFNAVVNVTDSSSNTATSNTLVITVTAIGAPLAVTATGTPTSGEAALPVSFTANPSGGTGTYTAYAWTFGDGTTGSGASVSHTYSAAGSFSATVKVTDSGSATATSSPITITVSAGPSVTASSNRSSSFVGEPVSFSSAVSGGTSPYTYAWTFGDSATSTVADPTHSYAATGTYSASVTVTDNIGHTATSNSVSITVTAAGAAIAITAAASPTSGPAPLSVTFTSTPTGGSGTYATFAWTFGDGTTGSGQDTTHSYSAAGSFSASVKVTDNVGHTATSNSVSITVTNPALAVTASVSPGTGTAGSTVFTFTAAPTGGTGSYSSYLWSFGDGTTGAGESATHTYTTGGTYTYSVTVTDSSDATASSAAQTLTVGAASVSPLTLGLSASPSSINLGSSATFKATVGGGTAPYEYAWSGLPLGCSSSDTPTLSCTPTSAGNYVVELTVSDASAPSQIKTADLNFDVNSTSTTTNSGILGLSPLDLGLVLLVVAVALVGLIAAVAVSRRRKHQMEQQPMAPYQGAPPPPGYYPPQQ